NCGVRPQNWHLHRAFAPHASRTVLVVHDRLDLRPGLSSAERGELARGRSRLLEGNDVVIGLSEGSIADVLGAHYVGHGCDETWRQPGLEALAEPEDLRDIPHPGGVYLLFL